MPAKLAGPRRLGRYIVLGTLGRGGMGTVLEAFDRTLDREVALKVLHKELNEHHSARLLREAQAMAKLSHPNVVQVYEADTVDGQTFVAMELVRGQTLTDWIRQEPRPDWRACVELFIQMGQGLAAAHKQGLVHRDFKPDNAIIDHEGRPRVLDFGLARQVDTLETDPTDDGDGDSRVTPKTRLDAMLGTPLTRTGTILGTPAYMPLEQIGKREADARSDQFSFCVSLYEAVYGERPFEATSIANLLTARMTGAVRPAPADSLVPARLRAVLLRGLARDADQRWPSMDALLQQLRQLMAPRRRRWLAGLSVGIAVGLGLAGVGLAHQVDRDQRCTRARAQMDGIWDDDRRQSVQAAILGTDRSYAPNTWDRVESGLDAYVHDWVSTHTEACEATRVRGEQSDEALDLRMRCLDQRRTTLRAAVDVLGDADSDVVDNAVALVAGLPTLTRCSDLRWLQQHDEQIPPPEDPDAAAQVQVLRERLAEIEAMDKAGRYAEALAELEPIEQHAQRLGYPPLRAEVLYWRGMLREKHGQYAEAKQDLRQAHALAVEIHHEPVALDTAQMLTFVVGHRLAQYEQGRTWGEMDALPLARRSGDPVQEAKSLGYLGTVFTRHGDLGRAELHHQQALALQQQALGPDHPHVAMSLNNLGIVFDRQGDFDSATLYYSRALEIQQQALGSEHPKVAMLLNNLGNVLYRQGALDDAERHHQRALAIGQRTLGPAHPKVAMSLANLGVVHHRRGALEEARLYHQRALAMLDETLDPDHPQKAALLSLLGAVLHDQGELDEARLHHQRALAMFDKTLGRDNHHGAFAMVGLAMVALERNDAALARAHAERAVSIREAATVEPMLLAEARFVLARALWHTRSERARARGLAEQARDALAEAKGLGDSTVDLAEVEAWLAVHHVP